MSCKKAPPSFTVGGKKKIKNQFCYILHLSGEKKSFKMNAMGKDFSQ